METSQIKLREFIREYIRPRDVHYCPVQAMYKIQTKIGGIDILVFGRTGEEVKKRFAHAICGRKFLVDIFLELYLNTLKND